MVWKKMYVICFGNPFQFGSIGCGGAPTLFVVLLNLLFLAAMGQANEPLPGTKQLADQGDLGLAMQQTVDRFLLQRINDSPQDRASRWNRDYTSPASYVRSIEPNRSRFQRIVGARGLRLKFDELQVVGSLESPPLIAETERITVTAVRWPVLPGISGEGLILEPKGGASCNVVALPDADWNAEVLAGVGEGTAGVAFARRLAESGARVIVPQLVDRHDKWSGNPDIRMLNQPHREFIYRPAFYLGRHIIGYEVQKVLSAVDYFARRYPTAAGQSKIGVAGFGEGALIALYAAALDQRIDAALVSGYFQRREGIWREPIYRNVWGLLREFGDAEIASLIAPRGIVVEACRGVEVSGPPAVHDNERDYAATGVLTTPQLASVRSEFSRARAHFQQLGLASRCRLVESDRGVGPCGSSEALRGFLDLLGVRTPLPPVALKNLSSVGRSTLSTERSERQFRELVDYNQKKYQEAPRARAKFWRNVDRSSLDSWGNSVEPYRDLFLSEIVGDWPISEVSPDPRTRVIYETHDWTGYEVVLDVTPKLWVYGILLVPKSIRPGEQRPVVVTQHGRGGRPQDVCDPETDHPAYHSFGARLAERGFVVFAPQNLYFGEENYRLIQRKANALGMSFFAPMVWQHRAVLAWLQSLPFVDGERIGFYGLSYGGKSALVIPAVLNGYCLSICSGAFSDTVKKHIDVVGGNRAVFLFTGEYEHLEFDFADRFNHAEIAWLISPRPFMVEKGHWDGGLPDEWTASEFARVRRHYVQLGLGEDAQIELFDGGHEINQKETYEFLEKHLRRR